MKYLCGPCAGGAIAVALFLTSGCMAPPAVAPTVATAEAPAAGEASAHNARDGAPASATRPALIGYWTRYWAPRGRAPGARYLLLADGRYAFAPAPGSDLPAQRGQWLAEANTLQLLADTGDRPAAGATGAAELLLGACPPNAEAAAVDPEYTCISFDGDAYFRHPVRPELIEQLF